MAENTIQTPGVFGGLMRYDSEYKSKFMFSPNTIIAFLIGIIFFVVILKVFWPI
jgi:preprotein translocase subunit Sec61beta